MIMTWKGICDIFHLYVLVNQRVANIYLYVSSSLPCSYALFDTNGNQIPQELVVRVGEVFENILQEVAYFQNSSIT